MSKNTQAKWIREQADKRTDAEKRLEAAEKECGALRASVATLEKLVADQKAALEDLPRVRLALETELAKSAELARSNAHLEQEVRAATKEEQAMRAEVEPLRESLERATSRASRLDVEAREYQVEAGRLRRKLLEAEAEIKRLRPLAIKAQARVDQGLILARPGTTRTLTTCPAQPEETAEPQP